MNLNALIRNLLIFVGLAMGGGLAIMQAVKSSDAEGEQGGEKQTPQAVALNTAKPPPLRQTPLTKPISLESGFGRSELTGRSVTHVPDSPLKELQIDRRWDINLALQPPKPPTDLPPTRASDEVVAVEEADEASLRQDFRFNELAPEARKYAEEALASLQSGTKLLKQGMAQFRQPGKAGVEGQDKIREAAELLRDARDKLYLALRIEPQDRELLDLMREAKANLYICLKHGIY